MGGRFIAVSGPYGSTGKTSFALALAIELAPSKLILIDADLSAPSLNCYLAISEPVSQVAQLARLAAQQRLTADVIANLTSRVKFRKFVFSVACGAASVPQNVDRIRSEMPDLIANMLQHFDLVIVEFGRDNPSNVCPGLEPDQWFYVTGADAVSIQRMLPNLDKIGNATVVFNRFRLSSSGRGARSELRQLVDSFSQPENEGSKPRNPPIVLPEDQAIHDAALLGGVPLQQVKKNSPYLVALRKGIKRVLQVSGSRRIRRLAKLN